VEFEAREKKSHFVHMTLPFLINIGFNWSMSSIPTYSFGCL
jgi:hypothetical protein